MGGGGKSSTKLFLNIVKVKKEKFFICYSSKPKQSKVAFTLAEVLITLGIIGIVAAMTLPVLIQNNKNKEVEAKLQKIYSVMNQAILMSEIDNGPKEYWPLSCDGETECKTYYNKYFIPYIKTIKTIDFSSLAQYSVAIYFTDGSVLVGVRGYDYFYYPNGKNFNKDNFGRYDDEGNSYRDSNGIESFSFGFYPGWQEIKFHYKKGFEPYKKGLSQITKETLTSGIYGCNSSAQVKAYCTSLIQLNGWKIPEDYPFKVK